MQGDSKVIEHLNAVLKNELTAVNQYFLHAKMLASWGLTTLAAKQNQESIGEMKHAEAVIERILLLEGIPNLQDLGKLLIGEDTQEILECDLKLEQSALPDLKNAIAHCETVQDYVSRDLFRQILDSEEGHIDWLEAQLGLIERIGLPNYLQTQI